jgi:hypothetical protein
MYTNKTLIVVFLFYYFIKFKVSLFMFNFTKEDISKYQYELINLLH